MQKLTRCLGALLAVLAAVLLASPAVAQGSGETIHGTLEFQDAPVAGVTITVTSAEGDEIGVVQTAADGTWEVPVPGPGDYTVVLDAATLPSTAPGIARDTVETNVAPQQRKVVLFRVGAPEDGGEQPSPSESEPSEGGEDEGEAPGGDNAEAEAGEDVTATGGNNELLQLFISGLRFGLILGLAGLGLSLVFGTTGLTNFAHGELIVFGAVAALLLNQAGMPVLMAALLATVLSGVFGWGQDRGFWRPLRKKPTGLIALMIISIGVSLFLRYLTQFIIGGGRETYDQYTYQDPVEIGPVSITPRDLIIMGICAVLLAAVALALTRTRMGKATRAVADNPALAAASGINVDRVITVVWTVGTALAGLSGVFFGMIQGVDYLMGMRILLLVFAATVLGGLGTAWGAMVGALVVGLFIEMSAYVVPSELKTAGVLVVLILILLVRPQGILGRRERVG
ncbi:branched-chain amino acid ABC transporter permease [Jiangella alkaliphila]|uniref:Amino acid/amide ABC transporter membrane protein 1, HAAT family n=1 Tax=Jiangella alkaliphila TaxID=419479 RepID=A0A1H2L347_9ACTN|nr:branched-chain amino acid ABC transporter permease [Jiangella alkaliphila]SDU75254.1 amino acid/amide ABC transporter membrane protein 1, HAAT family [Jiangella alkaliphila]